MTSVTLYSSWFCPFAQRVWIALLEKGIHFKYEEIDPYNKSPEFLAVSPRGLVPSIVHNDKIIYESTVCLEYIDEEWNSSLPKFLPKDPYGRATARVWVDFISKKIVPLFYTILQRQNKSEQEDAKSLLLKNLEILTSAMTTDGPFFMGNTLGLVDLNLVPFALRFPILFHYRNFEVPNSEAFSRFHTWMEAALQKESILKTMPSSERLLSIYNRYANNSAQSEVADAIRKGTVLP